jgi:predicted DsbA family dithiol-disulfide isomerase
VTDELIAGIGAAVPGLDGGQMVDDSDSDAVAEEMGSSASLAEGFGINSTPSFLIGVNGGELEVLDVGSLEPEPYIEAIDRALGT